MVPTLRPNRKVGSNSAPSWYDPSSATKFLVDDAKDDPGNEGRYTCCAIRIIRRKRNVYFRTSSRRRWCISPNYTIELAEITTIIDTSILLIQTPTVLLVQQLIRIKATSPIGGGGGGECNMLQDFENVNSGNYTIRFRGNNIVLDRPMAYS